MPSIHCAFLQLKNSNPVLFRRFFWSISSRRSSHLRPQLVKNMDPAASNQQNDTQEKLSGDQPGPRPSHEPLPLPLPDVSSTPDVQLNVSTGQAVKLDHLGPLVVNQDGTLSRISNWSEMSDIERSNTLRILAKRNKLRMEALKSEPEKEDGKGES